MFLTPAFLFYALFMLIPLIGAVYYSFTNWNAASQVTRFVGLSNYIEAFTNDPYFKESMLLTIKYTSIVVIVQNVLALLIALLIEYRNRTRNLFRTVFFMPNMVSLIISAFMWSFIFTIVLPQLSEYGLSLLDQGWLGNPDVAFYSIIIVAIWRGTGYMMIIYIAALQGVPVHLKEAAIIDGASSFQNFIHVTIPMIMHAITICVFLTLNEAFKVFDVVYGLTGGGPGRSTQVVALNIFEEAFSGNFRYGYANAKSMILFVIILIITIVQVYVMRGKEVES
ncbi:carbohydrate ABC transporter permease [Amphibacillus jilinensis]|uniref:carbohydrate ABC transporter permease n=1 Tax=Amphibacillus jilinensis TaxID=1216008 RepID=UPI0006861DEF|nr:sugar ABC transporter permease [Amphibacillus jilinensis]